MDAFGVTPDSHVILYGTEGCFSIPRVWYTFKAMGHPVDKVHIMDRSLNDWIDAGGPIEIGPRETIRVENLPGCQVDDNEDDDGNKNPPKYDTAVDAMNVVGMERVLKLVNDYHANNKNDNQQTSNGIIVDARSAGRFVGTEPEPRPGLRGGHMPGAFNVPFNTLLDDDNKKFSSKEEMISIFKQAGVDINTEKDIICSCGSGVTACWIALALEECGRDPSKTFIYDGSWVEWASDENTPVVK
jgi:thiosulfate/3-mercaptopyruvate sulfurtransferase